VIDVDAALSEEFLQVPIGQGIPQVPANRQQDDVRWESGDVPGGGGFSGLSVALSAT
jgi:hypothetical protein